MKEIDKREMSLVEGGANPVLIASIVGTILVFVVGVLHGYANPKKCN